MNTGKAREFLHDPPNTRARHGFVATLVFCIGPAALAQTEVVPPEVVAAASPIALPARLEVSATTLPRLDSVDFGQTATRLDMTFLPPRRSALGLALGMTSFSPPTALSGGPAASSLPSVDLGLHYRHTSEGNHQVDVTAWRRMTSTPDALTMIHLKQEPTFGARVEMRIKPVPHTGFVAVPGFVGFQLESGTRIALRKKNGKPALYFRTKF